MSSSHQTHRILLVEDDETNARVASTALRREGYDVRVAATGALAYEQVERFGPDLVVIDIGLPDISGVALARSLRGNSGVPILFLTARNDDVAKVSAYEAGGDDYLAKPYSPVELVLRVRAVLRRARTAPVNTTVHSVGAVVLDSDSHRVSVQGREVRLTPREFALLHALIMRPGHAMKRSDLLDAVWGPGFVGARSLLDACVHRLREKIEPAAGGTRQIETVRGIGFRLILE